MIRLFPTSGGLSLPWLCKRQKLIPSGETDDNYSIQPALYRGIMRSHHKKNILQSERGIAMITAVLACSLLMALALLIITIATKDLRVSTQTVAGKHAMTTAETAIYAAIQEFSPDHPSSFNSTGTTGNNGTWAFRVTTPTSGVTSFPAVGYSGDWTVDVYDVEARGTTSRYGGGTDAEILAGIGIMGPGGSTDY